VVNKQRLQLPVVAEDFTLAVALNQAQVMRQQVEDDARMDKESIAKAPEKFKTASSWKVFYKALETYLGQILGSGWIPLWYVIRRAAYPDPEAIYTTEQEQSVALAPLQGMAYQRNNIKVYGIIKQLVLEGSGCSHILPFDGTADDQSTWMASINHFEGDGFETGTLKMHTGAWNTSFMRGKEKILTLRNLLSVIWNVTLS
jgi:hypothetical protein